MGIGFKRPGAAPPTPSPHSGEDGSSSRAAREPANHRSSNLLSGAAQRRGQRSNKCGGMELLSHVNVAVNKAASFQSCRGGDGGHRGTMVEEKETGSGVSG